MNRDENGRQNDNNNNNDELGHRRGHRQGAFRNMNKPKEHAPGSHRPSSPSQQAQGDLSGLGKASGLNGKLNDISRGIGEVGKKDPNLERLGNGLGSAKSLGSGLAGSGNRTGDNGLQGKPNEKNMQSGLADPDKQPERQSGDPFKQPSGNGIGDQGIGNNNGDSNDPLGKYGRYMPQQLANLGSKAHNTYGKFMGGLSNGVQKAGKLAHLSIGKGTAMWVAKVLMGSAVVGGMFGAAYLYENNDDVLFGGNVCSTLNTGDQSYEGTSGDSGTGGDWTQKGTKEYKRAKELWDYCVELGYTGTQAAAFLGNAAHEGGGFHNLDQDQVGGGGGKGIFQFTPGSKYDNNPKSDHSWSIKNQVDVFMDLEKAAFSQWYHQTKNSHDIADTTNIFEKLIERGGIPAFESRDAMAQQAYSMFHGSSVKGNSSKIEGILGSGNSQTATSNSDTAEQANNLNCQGKDQGDVVAGDWDWPFTGFNPDKDVTGPQLFGHAPGGGFRPNGFHDGIDVGTATHTGDMHAIHGGVVKKIDCQGSTQNDLGYYILIESPDGYTEVYQEFAFSMEAGKRVTKVKVGDHVKTGQTIARLDPTTPNATHVHIGVYKGKASDWQTAMHHSFDEWHWQNPIEIIEKSKGK